MVACGSATGDLAETDNGNGSQSLTPSPAGSSPATGYEVAAEWLAQHGDSSAVRCAYSYPEDLEERPYAFEATVVSVSWGEYDEDAGGTPLAFEAEVNEVFTGDFSGAVTLHTWDFTAPGYDDGVDPTGARFLVATGDEMGVDAACGFTQPYSAEEAELWRTTFSG